MEKNIPSGLKIVFVVHMVVGAIFGVLFVLILELWGNLIGWEGKDPLIHWFLGAAVWGLTASSWFAYREKLWERIKIAVQMELVWLILGALISLYGFFLADAPALGSWLYFVVFAGLAAAFSFFCSQAQKSEKAKA